MDDIAIFHKNPASSIIQNENKSGWKSDIIQRGGGTDKKWNGPMCRLIPYPIKCEFLSTTQWNVNVSVSWWPLTSTGDQAGGGVLQNLWGDHKILLSIFREITKCRKAIPSYIFVSHKNAGRFLARFSEKKQTKLYLFFRPFSSNWNIETDKNHVNHLSFDGMDS